MIRNWHLILATGFAALVTFATPQNVMAQYGRYPPAPQYMPNQPPPYSSYQQPGSALQDLAGTWFMAGDEEAACRVIPSRLGDRAMFVNENGDRAEGFLRGNRILVPRWGNLQGLFTGNMIRWSNQSVWTR